METYATFIHVDSQQLFWREGILKVIVPFPGRARLANEEQRINLHQRAPPRPATQGIQRDGDANAAGKSKAKHSSCLRKYACWPLKRVTIFGPITGHQNGDTVPGFRMENQHFNRKLSLIW